MGCWRLEIESRNPSALGQLPFRPSSTIDLRECTIELEDRKDIDAIGQLCRELDADPFCGYPFIFRSRSGTAIRLLQHDSCEAPRYVE